MVGTFSAKNGAVASDLKFNFQNNGFYDIWHSDDVGNVGDDDDHDDNDSDKIKPSLMGTSVAVK